MSLLIAIILFLLAFIGVVAHKTYNRVPARELKRRAAKHEWPATKLYPAVAYGNKLRVLLWVYTGLTAAAGLVLLARALPVWLSILIIGPLLWIAFSLLPATRLTRPGVRLTVLLTPGILWLLRHLEPLLNRAAALTESRYAGASQTGLFERADLLQLLKRQQQQPDSRFSQDELEVLKRALTFSEITAGQVLTPRSAIKTVLADDTIGPVLIDELHQNGQDFALVTDIPKGPLSGVLPVRQLGIKSGGQVRDHMSKTVYYVHQQDGLGQVLRAFFATGYPLFVVVSASGRYLGVISVENILHQLLGHIPGDDFDDYTDLSAVAGRHARSENPSKDSQEVVE